MISSTVLNTDVCSYSWPNGNTRIHLPQVGAEIQLTYNVLAQNRIRGVGANVASLIGHSHIGFVGYHFFVLALTRISPSQGSKFKHRLNDRQNFSPKPAHDIFQAGPKLSVAYFGIQLVLEAVSERMILGGIHPDYAFTTWPKSYFLASMA